MRLFTEYFSLTPPLSFRHQLHPLHYFLHLNLSPYITLRRIHMQLVPVTVCTHPDAVYITYQDFLATICDTRFVIN